MRFKPRTKIWMAQKYYADRARAVSERRIDGNSRRLSVLATHEIPKLHYDQGGFFFPHPMRIIMGGTSPHPYVMGIAPTTHGTSVERRLVPTSLEARCDKYLLVVGPNGSGETTLLERIARGAPSRAHGCIDAVSGVILVPQVLPWPGDSLTPENT